MSASQQSNSNTRTTCRNSVLITLWNSAHPATLYFSNGSLRRLFPLRPLPGGRRLAAARTGASDCAGFAPNHKTKAVCHEPRFHSRPATLFRPPFCPFHQYRLVFSRCALVKKKTSRYRQKGKKHEIRRSQPQNQRSRGLPRAIAGVRAECSPHAVSRSDGEVSQLQLRQHHADCEAKTRCH